MPSLDHKAPEFEKLDAGYYHEKREDGVKAVMYIESVYAYECFGNIAEIKRALDNFRLYNRVFYDDGYDQILTDLGRWSPIPTTQEDKLTWEAEQAARTTKE